MSIAKKQIVVNYGSILETTTCIAMSSELEPRRLYVESFDNLSVALKPEAGVYDRPLWFNRDHIYLDDEDLFSKLTVAFREKNRQKLAKLWSEAKPWVPATTHN